MATAEAEFVALLDVEEVVDVERLRAAAAYGVAPAVRGAVWKYLLGVEAADDPGSEAGKQRRVQEYLALDSEYSRAPVVRQLVDRYFRRRKDEFEALLTPAHLERVRQKLERIICVLCVNVGVEPDPGLVSLVGPFLAVMHREADVYFSLLAFVERLKGEGLTMGTMHEALARFVLLLRSVLPELANHLEEEEVEANEWAVSWLVFALAPALPIASVLRLWDSYIASSDALRLHLFVCLAILGQVQEDVMELEDRSDIVAFVRRLPSLDIDTLLAQALNVRHDVRTKDIV